MNAKWLLIPTLALVFTACEQSPKRDVGATAPDNTAINARDNNLPTSGDQSESRSDIAITQQIRRSIVTDSTLSDNAKNIKIITQNGVVTLRGPVNTDQEKATIQNKVQNVPGVSSVNNLLEITQR